MASSAISCGVHGSAGHLSFGVIDPVRAALIIVFMLKFLSESSDTYIINLGTILMSRAFLGLF